MPHHSSRTVPFAAGIDASELSYTSPTPCRCGRFHPLEAFEPSLRSCRQQLARHAARRRERRRQAAAAKAATHGEAEPAAAAPQQQASVQQKRRRQPQIQPQRQEQQAQQTQLPQQLQQQAAAAAAAALPSTQDAGLVAQLPAAEPASKRRRTGSEGSTLSSHEAGVAGALGTVLGSGGSSGIFPPVPAAVAPKVPLLTAVPANWAAAAPAPTLSPAWMLQAAGLPLAAPQPAAPAAPVAAPAAAQALRPDSARTAEAAQLLAALMREPALASLLSPLQQRTPRQVSDPAALPSEAADGAALGEDGLASGPHPPSAWEAASRPLCRHAAPPAPQLEVSPPPPLPGTQHAFTAPQPPSAVLPPPCLPLLQAPSAGVAPPAPALGAVAAGLQRAATLELISRVQLAQVREL